MTDSPFFTVSKGGPPAEEDLPDGIYTVVLTDLGDPRLVDVTRGPKAGQSMELIDWTFVVSEPGSAHDNRRLEGSTSTASGPKSKAYAWITALSGGRPPTIGQQFSKRDLIGRLALATVDHGEDGGGGWPRIASLSGVPASMTAQRVAQAPEPAGGLRQTVAATSGRDDLPF